jgi:hypothetical protein
MEQQQRWSKTVLNGGSASLNGLITTLLECGCNNKRTLPKTWLLQFLDVMMLPFLYLLALYWTMGRLQRWQLEDDGDEADGGNAVGGGRKGQKRQL